jgi:hypothetical protein
LHPAAIIDAEGVMFTVVEVGRPFLLWVSVRLMAEADMSLTAKRLKVGGWVNSSPRPVLETRVLRVKAGESFTVRARKTDGFWVGERVPLDRVARKRPFSRRWRTVSTL